MRKDVFSLSADRIEDRIVELARQFYNEDYESQPEDRKSTLHPLELRQQALVRAISETIAEANEHIVELLRKERR